MSVGGVCGGVHCPVALMQSTPLKSVFTHKAAECFFRAFARESRRLCVSGSFAAAHCFHVEMFGLGVHPIWMKRAGASQAVTGASALLLTQPLEVIFIASHFIFPDI